MSTCVMTVAELSIPAGLCYVMCNVCTILQCVLVVYYRERMPRYYLRLGWECHEDNIILYSYLYSPKLYIYLIILRNNKFDILYIILYYFNYYYYWIIFKLLLYKFIYYISYMNYITFISIFINY